MPETTENSTRQPRSRLKGMAKNTVKRLDFAIRRPVAKPAVKTAAKPAPKPTAQPAPKPSSKSTVKPASKPTPKPVVKPAAKSIASSTSQSTPAAKRPKTPPAAPRKPVMANRGRFIDFAPGRPQKPLAAPGSKLANSSRPISTKRITPARPATPVAKPAAKPVAPVARPAVRSAAKATSVIRPSAKPSPVSKPASRSISSSSTQPAIRPAISSTARSARPATKPAARPSVRPSVRPAIKSATRPAAEQISRKTAIFEEDDFSAALAGFADNDASDQPVAHPARDRGRNNFDEEFDALDTELDALDSISDEIFDDTNDDIDAIENEIEAETNDFVKAPKPLFEDPLVMLSKVRDERRHKKEAAEAAEFKERTKKEAKKASYLAPYTLGGRSPFLTSVNVEKRPLSSSVPQGGTTSQMPAKSASKSTKVRGASKLKSPIRSKAPIKAATNTYRSLMRKQLDQDAKEIHRQTMMVSTPDTKKHNTGLIIAVILTVLLGAGVGMVLYLMFFQ